MARSFLVSLLIMMSVAPAWAQTPVPGKPLQGSVEHQDASTEPKLPPFLQTKPPETKLPPFLQPPQSNQTPTKFPNEDDLRPVKGSTPSHSGDTWSMTVYPEKGMTLDSPDRGWSVEYSDGNLRHQWDVWLSRLLQLVYKDCVRFRCPLEADHSCTVYIRRDGIVVADITNDGDIPSTLFRNAFMRLQGQRPLDFPTDSHMDKVQFNMNLHYGKPIPTSSVYIDAFGQTDARYPLQKTR